MNHCVQYLMEYSNPQEVVDAIFGMQCTIVGNSDSAEVRLLDRIINVPSSIFRGKARGGDDKGITEDSPLGMSTIWGRREAMTINGKKRPPERGRR